MKDWLGLAIDSTVIAHPSGAYDAERVRRLVRDAVTSALGEPSLRSIVPCGATVLLKPNWVTDRNEGVGGTVELYTHREVLLAVLDLVLAARPSSVLVGDAPIQSCRWDRLVDHDLERAVLARSASSGIPVGVLDFRRTIMRRSRSAVSVAPDQRDRSRYVLFDLGHDSLLEPITKVAPDFRVAAYDQRALAAVHRLGRHQYLLCREAFDADVVVSLPKLKTHCKAGLTGALKNLVGLNGNKDYLPHHRLGGTSRGGDSYAGESVFRRLAEAFEDAANMRLGKRGHVSLDLVNRTLRFLGGGAETMGGAWHGNDTCWRMVLDLNRILAYGDANGRMHDERQRRFYSLTDAIICGEGDGPLRPTARPLGVVTFASSPSAADEVHALLLGLDPDRIPLIRESRVERRWSLAPDDCSLRLGDRPITREELPSLTGVTARAPKGWLGQIELRRPRAFRGETHA